MKNEFYFESFQVAVANATTLATYFALKGYHVNMTAAKMVYQDYAELSVFHDGNIILSTPLGVIYSCKEELERNDTYWTQYRFVVAK